MVRSPAAELIAVSNRLIGEMHGKSRRTIGCENLQEMILRQVSLIVRCFFARLGGILLRRGSNIILSSADIQWFSTQFLCEHRERYRPESGGEPSFDFLVAVVAKKVIQHYLGHEWVRNNIFGHFEEKSFFYLFRRDAEDAFKFQDRLINVAECLINLQHALGFGLWIEAAKRRVDVEAAVAELSAARLLLQSDADFSFVMPSGVPDGANYDMELHLSNGTSLPCEIKCKIEDTDLSGRTIKNTLKKVRRQLPKDAGGIVFIRLPEWWTKIPGSQPLVESSIIGSIKRTSRIALVILHWEEWHLLPRGQAIRDDRFWPLLNPNADRNIQELSLIVSSMMHGGDEELEQVIRQDRINAADFRRQFASSEEWLSLHTIVSHR